MTPEAPDDYRRRAGECEKLAADAQDPRARNLLFQVAARWRSLANEDEQRYRRTKRLDITDGGSQPWEQASD
jgi:hypothetical protein